jgi:hypothetical protein
MTLTERICSVQGCGRGGKLTRGMCAKHYRYWIDHTPKDQRPLAPRFARRFWDYVDKSGDCWIWTGPTNRKGYGWWSGGGTRGLAHRLALAASVPCPDDALLACHHCDNPPCVKPTHIYWGTEADNARDVMERGAVVNQNVLKTHCKRGHPLAGDNLRIVGASRSRQCHICSNKRSREWQRRRRTEREAAS